MRWLIILAACRPTLPAVNDPEDATSFYCTASDTRPERSECTIDRPSCDAIVQSEAGRGAFMSPCVAQTRAWCTLVESGTAQRFVCAPDRDDCMRRVDDMRARRLGECVEREAGR